MTRKEIDKFQDIGKNEEKLKKSILKAKQKDLFFSGSSGKYIRKYVKDVNESVKYAHDLFEFFLEEQEKNDLIKTFGEPLNIFVSLNKNNFQSEKEVTKKDSPTSSKLEQ